MSEQPGPPYPHPQWTTPAQQQQWASPAPPSGPPYPASGVPYGPGNAFTVPSAPPYGGPVQPYGVTAQPQFATPPTPGRVRVDPIPGTEFGVAYLAVPPTVSGLAAGSLVTGIASIVMGMIVGCLGLAGVQDSSGPIFAGAFSVLAGLLGFGGVGLGYAAVRQIKASRGRITGRGVGIAGMSCGGVGVLFTSGGLALALALLAA